MMVRPITVGKRGRKLQYKGFKFHCIVITFVTLQYIKIHFITHVLLSTYVPTCPKLIY